MSGPANDAPCVLIVRRINDDREYSNDLRAARFDVAEVVDHEGISGVLRAQPDVVVVDLGQSEWFEDGTDLAQRLRQDERTKDVPILLLSRSITPEDEERAERAGADRVLPKPCPPEVLACEVRRVIAARRRQSFQGKRR